MRYNRIIALAMRLPWAILPEKLAQISALLALRAAGGQVTAEQVQAITAAARQGAASRAGAVAVLPVFGTIMPRADAFMQFSGGTSLETLGRDFRAALADPDVGSIVMLFDSPGGSVYGVPEMFEEIMAARGQKRIVAQVDPLAASAAYFLAAAADEIVMSPSSEAGSIGVWTMHEDWSEAYKAAGVNVSLISAGKFKTEGNPYEPLTDDARQAIQENINAYYEMFVKAVARGRGVKAADVRGGFGQGRVVVADQAVKLGMADRISPLRQTLKRLGAASDTPSQIRAEAVDTATVQAEETNDHAAQALAARLRLERLALGQG